MEDDLHCFCNRVESPTVPDRAEPGARLRLLEMAARYYRGDEIWLSRSSG
jgi:hypothetical protein